MALITEAHLREQFGETGDPSVSRYELPAGTVVTPSARAWLIDHRIDLVIGGRIAFAPPKTGEVEQAPAPVSALPAFTAPKEFDVIDGSKIDAKPEHLTALRGNLLVPKNHPQIKFRGMLDALEADIVAAQVVFHRLGLDKGVDDLRDVLRYTKQILRCEVLDVPFEDAVLFGLDDAALRERSHHPQQYFGLPHFAASMEDGEAVVLLNQLRTKVRQVELAAYDAFAVAGTEAPSRIDIIQALNRLSSGVYIMMYKAKTKEYE